MAEKYCQSIKWIVFIIRKSIYRFIINAMIGTKRTVQWTKTKTLYSKLDL